MKENENLKTETPRASFFFFLFIFYFLFYGKGYVEFGYIVYGLNGSQWVFS